MPPSGQQYDCTGCGECCRGRFAIIITDADKQRIEGQNWTDADLGLKGKPLFTKVDGGFHLAHRADGACVFLQEDNLCRIHANFGEPAKPVACRLYPFTFVPQGNQVRVDLRYDCPATAGNLGRPIAAHLPDLNILAPQALPADVTSLPVPAFADKVTLPWDALVRITETYAQVLGDISVDITRRVAGCVNLTEVLRQQPVGTMTSKALTGFLRDVAAEVQEAAVDDDLEREEPAGPVRLSFRQLAGLYGRIDTVGAKAPLGQRLTMGVKMLAGKGTVPEVRPDFPKVAFDRLEGYFGIPTGAAALALERYLHTHLMAMGFFGRAFYGRSYLDGMGALLLTYPMVCWYARAYAIGGGRDQIDVADVEHAIMIVDHQHGVSPFLDLPTERSRAKFLTQHSTLRSLVVWYGS